MDSTVYSNDDSPDASTRSETLPSQQITSFRNPTDIPVPYHFNPQYLPPTQYTPELSDLNAEQRSSDVFSTHSRVQTSNCVVGFPGSFPDTTEQEPPVRHPSFNMSLKLGVTGTAPTYPSQTSLTSFSTPVKQRLSSSRPPHDERRLKADEILPLLQKELSFERNISQSSSFVDLLFPLSRLPFPIDDSTLEYLAGLNIWNTEDAHFNLKFNNYKEPNIAQWLNVVKRLIGAEHSKRRIRLWYSGTCDSPPEGSQHVARPDLVLLNRNDAERLAGGGEKVHWRMIRAFAEVTSQSPLPTRISNTVDRKSYILFLMQDNRCFVPALIFGGGGYFSLTITDHQGQIRMSPMAMFSPGKDTALVVLRILAFFMYAPIADIGLDPSMLCDNAGKIESILVNNQNFAVVKRIYSLQALIGHGTKIWIVKRGERHYILKDSWVLAGRVKSEIDFLDRFAKYPELLGIVPALIQGEHQ
jgi:hypothetical protein